MAGSLLQITKTALLLETSASNCFYVHLCSGGVNRIVPADRVLIDATTFDFLDGERVTASYRRRDVLFCSQDDVTLPYV